MSGRQNELRRCYWCEGDALYEHYHDEEWGVPVFDLLELFERLALESMQAGLSWITVLKKREHMRKRFMGFDPQRLALCDETEISDWLKDKGLIRHRGKLQALVQNARLVLQEPDFVDLIWQFAPRKACPPAAPEAGLGATENAKAMAKTLKSKGFKFVGPTICYAFMQSAGLVNDHARDCWRFSACEELQRSVPAQ